MDGAVIFVEGLPGSGKSTTALHLYHSLLGAGIAVTGFGETDLGNPLHVGELDGFGAAMAEIHLQFTPDQLIEAVLQKYRDLTVDRVAIFESFPIQSHMRLLFQMDASRGHIETLWLGLQEALAPWSPALVFLRSEDPARAILSAAELRGPQWTEYIVNALEKSPVATANGWTGLSGVAEIFKAYGELVDELVERWRFPKLILPAKPESYAQRDTDCFAWALGALT